MTHLVSHADSLALEAGKTVALDSKQLAEIRVWSPPYVLVTTALRQDGLWDVSLTELDV